MSRRQLPDLGHIEALRKVDVAEPLERAHFERAGNHVFIGQRKHRGSNDALIYLGKCIESTRIANKYDANVWLDVRTPHVIYIVGKRGSGKSYDLGILAEGLLLDADSRIATKDTAITTVIFDTQDQFWALGGAPSEGIAEDRDQIADVRKWGLAPERIGNIRIFSPRGESSDIANTSEYSIDPAELSIDDWCSLLQEDRYTPIGHTVETLLDKVAHKGYTTTGSPPGGGGRRIPAKPRFDLKDLLECLRDDQDLSLTTAQQTRNAVLWRLSGLSNTSLFASGGMNARDLLRPGQLAVFLMRKLDNATKAIVVSVLAKQIFTLMGEFHTRRKVSHRTQTAMAPGYEGLPDGAWVIIDEAHLVCPADQHTSAKAVLIEYVKRGRDAGLSLVLATQQPSAIDPRVLSQADVVITHRLVMESDINAALSRMPAGLPTKVGISGQDVTNPSALIRMLDTREAWIADAESSRAFLVAMRPRLTAHGGDEPVLVK
ncbi:MAG: ATP-binding protein [Terriglobales bacterium]